MKSSIVLFVLCVTVAQSWAQTVSKPSSFNFQAVNVSQVVQLIYGEVLVSPYVIDPDVLNDSRTVSFRYGSGKGDIKEFLYEFLESLGYAVQNRKGVDYITKRKPEENAHASAIEEHNFVYRPLHSDTNYIARLLAPMFKGGFSVNRAISGTGGIKSEKTPPDGSAASLSDQNADVLVFSGTDKEIAKLKKLLPQVDFALGEVVVRGVVYEVTTSEKDGSAFGLLAGLASGKLNIGLGTIGAIGNFIQFKNASIDAVYTMLANDSRFKVILNP